MSMRRQRETRKFLNATARLIILALILCLQITLAALLANYLERLSFALMIVFYTLGLLACSYISVYHDNPSTRIFWLILIAISPSFGLIVYLLWGMPRRKTRRHRLETLSRTKAAAALARFAEESLADSPEAATQAGIASRFLQSYGFPIFDETAIRYFPSGEDLFDDCLKRMTEAETSLFLSFFILREGKLWDRFKVILCQKARAGVDVRILLDDAGTMFNIDKEFIAELERSGVRVLLFNPTHRYLNNLYLNYRNHQKILVVDGDTGYTGGVNLADEYANYTAPFGYWKDTGVRLDGRAVFGLTAIFLDMWERTQGSLSEEYEKFRPASRSEEKGRCIVFSDGPGNNPENPAEGLIFRMIESAHRYVYLTTPYLAVSNALIESLCRVAQSGVRVVLVVPFQLDHWYVFEVTQSNFMQLITSGVEVYRYSPGMMHAKMIVADDVHALVSTINLDNRSFYSQYEDGVWFCGKDAVSEVRKDVETILSESTRITIEDTQKIGFFRTAFGLLMRVFAPLM